MTTVGSSLTMVATRAATTAFRMAVSAGRAQVSCLSVQFRRARTAERSTAQTVSTAIPVDRATTWSVQSAFFCHPASSCLRI